jgi:hypothetical protein
MSAFIWYDICMFYNYTIHTMHIHMEFDDNLEHRSKLASYTTNECDCNKSESNNYLQISTTIKNDRVSSSSYGFLIEWLFLFYSLFLKLFNDDMQYRNVENVSTRHVTSWINSKHQTFRNTKNRDIQKYRDVVTKLTGRS